MFADLDNDEDLDLVVTRNARDDGDQRDTRSNALYRNDGGRFVDVTEESNLAVPGMKARNVIPLDYDGDGALDLFIVEDLTGDIGSKLFHNEGDLRFRDRTGESGLPTDLGGLGAAVGDVSNDGWPDIFVAHEDKLFVNDGGGSYRHAADLDEVFRWPGDKGSEDWRAGAAFGDANRDGRLDLVVGHHYGSADKAPQSVRLYLNRSGRGSIAFEDVTSQAGLDPIPVKAPHVEMQDMDNDGWPDIVVSVHAVQEGAATPLVFRNRGGGDVPTFETPPFSVPADRESNLGYWPAAPTVDFDRDGRLDLFGVEWVPAGIRCCIATSRAPAIISTSWSGLRTAPMRWGSEPASKSTSRGILEIRQLSWGGARSRRATATPQGRRRSRISASPTASRWICGSSCRTAGRWSNAPAWRRTSAWCFRRRRNPNGPGQGR